MAQGNSLKIVVEEGYFRAALEESMKSAAPVLVLTSGTLEGLTHEVGSAELGILWLLRMTARYDKPIGVHHGTQTWFISPPTWTFERLKGYVQEFQPLLDANFGASTIE